MKRAFWYDKVNMDDECWLNDQEEYNEMYQDMLSAVEYMNDYCNRSYTENGALVYDTTNSALLDLNFKVSSLRDYHEDYVMEKFEDAYKENPKYAVKWLFFLRDILEGLGERNSFRICLKQLAVAHPEIAKAVIKLVPEYGRFDDVLVLLDTDLSGDVARMYREQLKKDIEAMKNGRGISLLAKWLPSINTSSKQTKAYAGKLCGIWGMSGKEYRQMLSKLRAYSNVLETKISASKWDEVDYEAVPAMANLKYDQAFAKHDYDRRREYLEKALAGDSKLNAKGVMPYDITRRYCQDYCRSLKKEDILAELMWNKIATEGFNNE